MQLRDLFGLLSKNNIEISLCDGRLNTAGNVKNLPEYIQNILRDKKIAIVHWLEKIEQSQPMTMAQKILWSLHQSDKLSGKHSCNKQVKLHIDRPFDHVKLSLCLNKLIERHESLRTVFEENPFSSDEEVLQVVNSPFVFDVPLVKIHSETIGRAMLEQATDRISLEQGQAEYDLSKGPLFRVCLIELPQEKQVLLFSYHQSILDDMSVFVLLRELMTAYRSKSLPPVSISYTDYTKLERQRLNNVKQNSWLTYWEEQLGNMPGPLSFPHDNFRQGAIENNYAHKKVVIKKTLVKKLSGLSKRENLSLLAVCLTALKVSLMRYTGQTDIAVSSSIPNRESSELKEAIGLLSNAVILRSDLSDSKTLIELLKWINSLVKQASENLPIPDRILADIPLCQVSLELNSEYISKSEFGDRVSGIPRRSPIHAANFELALILDNVEERYEGFLEYNADLFSSPTIQNILQQFQTVLAAIAEDPEQDVMVSPLLTEAERRLVVHDWNQTEVIYPPVPYIANLFEAQVELSPNELAVVYQDQSLSYQELNRLSNQLAHYLVSQGVGPNVRVGLCVERSPELAMAVLGILKAGGAYVPLDPNYPQDRLIYMLEHANADILLTQSGLKDRIPEKASKLVYLDQSASWLNGEEADQNPTNRACPEDLAYVIYTSGSTGRPKAVAMPQRALINLIQWQREHSNCKEGSLTLQFSPISFDVSFQELFATWYAGGTLVMVSESTRKDPFALWSFVSEKKINRLFMPFIALHQLAEANGSSEANIKPETLIEIVTAGEQLQITPAIRQLFQLLPQCKLFNQYGPSETHVVTALELEGSSDTWEAFPTIGRPVANNTTYLLDQTLQPVPSGDFGELYIGGKGLALGYLGRDDLTEDRFIRSPFSADPEVRLYKTGDLARYRRDGTIEYKGRMDDQVKIRGFRIELGEIEQVLLELTQVCEAIVSVDTHNQDALDKYLVAYVVLKNDKKQDMDGLRKALLARLPNYMVPSVFVPIDSLPKTLSGKIDRRILSAQDTIIPGSKYRVRPRTETEKQMVSIWADVFNVISKKVSIDTRFLELGGQSLLATRIASQVRKTFGVSITLADIFNANTVASLAQIVDKAQKVQSLTDAPPLVPVDRSQNLPLSFSQQRLWFINQFDGYTDARYNEPLAFHLRGELNVIALTEAMQTIIQRHESLRTTFQKIGSEVVQFIANSLVLNIPVIEITETSMPLYLDQYIAAVFDLEKGPLIKISLLWLESKDYVLLINMHHIICDGWSVDVFGSELANLYSSYKNNNCSELEPLPVQYSDFSQWQRQWLKKDVLEEQLNYWRTHLSDSPALLRLPTDRPRPALQSFRGSHYKFSVSAVLAQQVRRLGNQEGATLFMTLLAAFNILLARCSGQTDICVGTPIANRQREEVENLIGFFVNTLVFRVAFDSCTSVIDLLQSIKTTAFSAFSHQDIPFDMLVQTLNPKRSPSSSPLFQVMFVLQSVKEEAFKLQGIDVSPIDIENPCAKFDLTFTLVEKPEELTGIVEYNTDIFDVDTIGRICKIYLLILTGMVADPHKKIYELSILAGGEKQKILHDWNKTVVDYPKDKCVYQLFEEQVEKTPDTVAVIFEDQQLTYEELNQRSNQLAHYLIERGVKPEVKVGLCVGRSLGMMIALLGIQKAGGVYVPIDPGYPQQRIDYLVKDSGIALILTQTQLSTKVFSKQGVVSISLDRDWAVVDTYSRKRARVSIKPESLIYVIYTSGSTGKPKGVQLSHGAYTNHMQWIKKAFDFSDHDKILHKTPLIFDAAGWEWSLPLMLGAQLILAKPEGHRDPEYLLDLMDQYQITVFQAVPSLLNLLLDDDRREKMNSLRFLFCGGEPLPVSTCVRFKESKLTGLLCNLYGPTEAAIDSTYWVFNKDKPPTTIPIGRPIDNVQIYLLDEELNPAPIGVLGEIYIGGDGLSRGYLNREDLTAEKFVSNPFDKRSGLRLYRSGDLGRYLPDGNIEYVGRIDTQVKVRGFRIELGEVENTLIEQENIREAVVLTHSREEDAANHYLVAYIVCEKSAGVDQTVLRTTLRKQLPDHMIPNFFILMEELPLTFSGKVDRKALPEPDEGRLITQEYIEPCTETEQVLVTIWGDILNLSTDRISIRDNFFELGGHSILAMHVASSIKKTFKTTTRILDLFTHSTVQEMASLIDSQLKDKNLVGNILGEDAFSKSTDRERIRI